MPEYQLRWARLARKELERLPSPIAERIYKRVSALAQAPRPSGTLKLKGGLSWRIRIRDYRVIYSIDDAEKIVRILVVNHRKDVYREL